MHCNYVDSAKEALGMLLGLGFQLLFFGWIHELCTAVHDRSSRRKGMIHWFHPAVAIALAAAICLLFGFSRTNIFILGVIVGAAATALAFAYQYGIGRGRKRRNDCEDVARCGLSNDVLRSPPRNVNWPSNRTPTDGVFNVSRASSHI